MINAAVLSSQTVTAGIPAVGITLCSNTKRPPKSQPGIFVWFKRFVLSSCALILHLKADSICCSKCLSPELCHGDSWVTVATPEAHWAFCLTSKEIKGISWIWLFLKEHPSGTQKYKLHHQGLGNNLLLFLQKPSFNVTSFHFIWAEMKHDEMERK